MIKKDGYFAVWIVTHFETLAVFDNEDDAKECVAWHVATDPRKLSNFYSIKKWCVKIT